MVNNTIHIATGFKQTKIGIIPENWEVKKLVNIAFVKTGPFGAQLHQKDYVREGTPIITVEHLSEQGIVHENLPLVSDADKQRLKQYTIEKNDIVFSRVGAIDRNALVTIKEAGWLFSGRLLRVRIKNGEINSKFLSYYFHTSNFKKLIIRVAVGQTMASLNTSILSSMSVVLPPLPEQRAIAACLSTWDKAIDKTQKLIEQLKQRNKGLMQQLLTGKIRLKDENGERFCGEWKERKLGELLNYEQPTKYLVKDTNYNDSYPIPVLTAGKTFILGYTNETKSIYDNLPAVIFDDFTTASKFVDFPFKAKSSAMKILKPINGANLIFVYGAMQLLDYKIGGHKRHWISKFTKLKILCPPIEEQTAIASVLDKATQEVQLQEEKLAVLKEQKKGLMQVLLTGKLRLHSAQEKRQNHGLGGLKDDTEGDEL